MLPETTHELVFCNHISPTYLTGSEPEISFKYILAPGEQVSRLGEERTETYVKLLASPLNGQAPAFSSPKPKYHVQRSQFVSQGLPFDGYFHFSPATADFKLATTNYIRFTFPRYYRPLLGGYPSDLKCTIQLFDAAGKEKGTPIRTNC